MRKKIPGTPKTAPEAELRPFKPLLFVQVLIVAVVAGGILGTGMAASMQRAELGDYHYSLVQWQAETTPGVLFRLAGIEPDVDAKEEEAILQTYFRLTSEIREEEEQVEPDRERIAELRSAREEYTRDTERIIRDYVDDAITTAGLQQTLPLFDDVSFTWPPVEFKLAEAPNILVRSPRDTIRRYGDTMIRGDLTLDDIEDVEGKADDEDSVSMVISIGGIASYPAIISADRNYWGVVELAAHEWLHHYLAFYPLGQQWFKGGDAFTLNETVANIGGRALASIVHERHPVSFPDGADGSMRERPEATVDRHERLRRLRVQVDALLELGMVDEAERLMDETQGFLMQHGVPIRRLNQAYFAFFGTYGDTAAAGPDPIGEGMAAVWEATQEDVALFIELVRDIKTVADLDELVDELTEAGLVADRPGRDE